MQPLEAEQQRSTHFISTHLSHFDFLCCDFKSDFLFPAENRDSSSCCMRQSCDSHVLTFEIPLVAQQTKHIIVHTAGVKVQCIGTGMHFPTQTHTCMLHCVALPPFLTQTDRRTYAQTQAHLVSMGGRRASSMGPVRSYHISRA